MCDFDALVSSCWSGLDGTQLTVNGGTFRVYSTVSAAYGLYIPRRRWWQFWRR